MIDGQNVRPVRDEEGASVQGGIRRNQTGNISLPNIVEARRMAQAIRSSRTSRVLAGTDDFLYDHVTQGFFKPLVLMSGGYGLHISLAEAIPNTLRHGITTSVEGLYHRAIANLGYKADKEELGLLGGWLYNVAGVRALQNSTDAQYLTEVYLANEGYKTTTGVAAGEITQGETQPVELAVGSFRQTMATSTKEGSQFSTFGNEEPRILKIWQADLREAANDKWTRTAADEYLRSAKKGMDEGASTEAARQAVAEQLRSEPQDTLDNFVRSKYKSANAPPGWDAIDDWSSAIVDALKTDVHARPTDDSGNAGKLHTDLLQSVANGHTPTVDDLDKINPSGSDPLQLKGPNGHPRRYSGAIQRIANFGFRKILNPMVNILSPQPGVRRRVRRGPQGASTPGRCRGDAGRRGHAPRRIPSHHPHHALRPQPPRQDPVDGDDAELGTLLLCPGAGVPEDGTVAGRRPRGVPPLPTRHRGSRASQRDHAGRQRQQLHRLPRVWVLRKRNR